MLVNILVTNFSELCMQHTIFTDSGNTGMSIMKIIPKIFDIKVLNVLGNALIISSNIFFFFIVPMTTIMTSSRLVSVFGFKSSDQLVPRLGIAF